MLSGSGVALGKGKMIDDFRERVLAELAQLDRSQARHPKMTALAEHLASIRRNNLEKVSTLAIVEADPGKPDAWLK